MSSYSSSDEEDNLECPLCMEEIDLADKYFKPCICGYQICRFCWHHIKEDLNGLCPGCRREYTEEMVQFKPVSPEELAQLKAKRKAKKREKKEQENIAKKHYANVRVIQKNLVYVIGLPSYVANEETIKQYDYFGQYGKITKVVINKKTHSPHQSSVGIYITFSKKEEAERAIEAVDNIIFDGRQVKASYGTTKYCTFYLRGQTCQNPQCMYLHEPGEEIESKEDLLNKTQVLTSQASTTHIKEVKPTIQPKAIKTTIYREKDETSALPASANWGSRNGKTRIEDNENKAISISLSDLLTKSNENSKMQNINLSRSKSDSHSSLKTKIDTKIKPTITNIKNNNSISTMKNESVNIHSHSHSEKIIKSNINRDEEYPALSSLLNKKNNHSKEGHVSSNSSLTMSPQTIHSKLNINVSDGDKSNKDSNNRKLYNNDNKNEYNGETDKIEGNLNKKVFENKILEIENDKHNVINEENSEDIPKTESPIPVKEEIEIKSEEKSEIENDIKEASKKSILEEISKAYQYDQTIINSNDSSPSVNPVSTVKLDNSSFNIFTELNVSPNINSKVKTKNTNSPPPGFENKIEPTYSESNISNLDLKLNEKITKLGQSINGINLSDDEIIPNSSAHVNEFKYNGPFDPFNEIVLNNLMNVNTIMNNYSKHFTQKLGGYNTMFNNGFNGINQINPLMNELNIPQYQSQFNQKYTEQYYQNLNCEQIQNNLRAMLPNVNITPYSNGNENNLWSNQGLQNNINENLINNFNSMATALNGNVNNNILYNNFNNMNFLKQLQMTQMLNNMQKTQQIENNLNITNNVNLNNSSQDFKSLPFKDSAIMAVKMSNNNVNNSIDNSSHISNNLNSINLFQNMGIKSNEIANNVGFNLNPINSINSFSNINNFNQINGLNNMSNINGINSLNMNNMNNINSFRNINHINGYSEISSLNGNLNSTSTIIPNLVSNISNLKGMNELNKEGLGGIANSKNSIYDDDKTKFFQSLSEMNKEEIEKNNMLKPDFCKSKIQDTGGGNDERTNLLTDSILEQRFNEAEIKSIEYNKNQKEYQNSDKKDTQNNNNNNNNKNNNNNNNNEFNSLEFKSNNKIFENDDLQRLSIKNEILDILTTKKLKENEKSESFEFKPSNDSIIKSEINKSIILNNQNVSNSELLKDTYENNEKHTIEKLNIEQEKENLNNNINELSTIKNKEKKENIKSNPKKELSKIVENESSKTEPLIIKFETKQSKNEEIKKEINKEESLNVKLGKEESMTFVVSKKNKKEEKKLQKKKVKDEVKNNTDSIVNQVNIFEVLPDVTTSDNTINNNSINKKENNKTSKIVENIVKNQEIITSNTTQVISGSKKNKKKSKHKKKKSSVKEHSLEENIDLINKELDMNEKKTKEIDELNKNENENISQTKKKKKSKKKNNDIELHILNVKDSKTQLMKETQLYRLPLTAIAKKLIPEDSGTTLGLKPIFPPDIEIEALCNVIVTKRSKKKKRENINLPFFNTKIGQLKSEFEDEKNTFNYIDDDDENIVIERNEKNNDIIESKEMDILKNHNMEVNMITSLKQIKRRNLKNIANKIELNNENNMNEGDLIENLNEDFLNEDIDDLKENLNNNSKNLIDIKIPNKIIEKHKLLDLNKVEHEKVSSNSESQYFVFQALDALINTAEVYANALKKQIEEYEKKDYNIEDSKKYSNNYKRKVKIYEAVLESIKDIREMGLSDYKTLEKVYFSDMKGEDNYEDNISNLLISVKYIMQELVLNVDEQEVLPQILTLNKNTNILLSKMNCTKFKDSVLEQYKKLYEDGHMTSYSPSFIGNQHNTSIHPILFQNNVSSNNKSHEENQNFSNNDLPPLPQSTSKSIDSNKKKISEIIEPESLKMVNRNIKNFLKDCKLDEVNKKIKIKKNQSEPSTSNIELQIEYENEEVKNRIEKMSKSDNELLNSTEDILLELILKSQENQELKTKLISNCLNFDINLAKRLAHSLRMKGKDKEKLKSIKKSEIHQSEETKLKNKMNNGNNENVEITLIDGEVIIKKH